MYPSPITSRITRVAVTASIAIAAFAAGVWWRDHHPEAVPPAPIAAPDYKPVDVLVAKNVRAEFNPQSALLIGANELIRYQQPVFKDLVGAIHTRLPVIGIINDDEDLDLGRELLEEAGLPVNAVHFIKHPLNSMWLRDFGPIFTRWTDGQVRIVDTAYGQADEDVQRQRDDAFPAYLGHVLGLAVDPLPLVIEGGNLLLNGDGLMVTTTRVIEREENRRYTVPEIGAMLQRHLGCKVWIYVRELQGEPTGHVDFFITFLRRNLAVVAALDPAVDPVNAAILDEAATTLATQHTSMGPLLVERIPMPPRSADGSWRSYNNILLVNGMLLMPSYADVEPALEADARALYERLMPSWEIVSITADSLVPKRGVLHCIGIGVPGYVNITPLLDQASP